MTSQLSNYKVGLVLSQAGFNRAQLAEIKARLKMIAQAGGAEPDGITLTVPSLHHPGPSGAAAVELLVEPLQRISYLRILIVEDVCAIPDCIELFKKQDVDEVWCMPSERQSVLTHARAWKIYDYARTIPFEIRRYKLIPPWVEASVAPAKETKTKAKG